MYDYIDSKSDSSLIEETYESKREQLIELIKNWNENRLELFAISMPEDDSLEIYGAMRFYFRDTGEKVFSKCIRVSSTATTENVIEALVEKFRPDMKMLTTPEYSLWESHGNGNERKLEANERPLLVQLNWHNDDKDGRFILKNDNEPEKITRHRGRFSKRFKNELKKRSKSIDNMGQILEESKSVTEEIFSDTTSNPFNRTISNPEIVLKKRREKKLENKLKEIIGNNGGSLKIYGYNIDPSKNYVSILVSLYDRASKILSEALEKYGLGNEDPSNFVLTQKIVQQKLINETTKSTSNLQEEVKDIGGMSNEIILGEDECPLLNFLSYKENKNCNKTLDGEIIFSLKRRSSITQNSNHNCSKDTTNPQYQKNMDLLPTTTLEAPCSTYKLICKRPIIVPINILTGKENHDCSILIQPNVTIIGSSLELGDSRTQGILLNGSNVTPRHCLISFSEGNVSITPLNSRSVVEVNGQEITSTTLLRDGFTIKIGDTNKFRFYSNSLGNPTISTCKTFDSNPYATPILIRRRPSHKIISPINYNVYHPIIYPPQNLPGLIEVSNQHGNDELFLSILINSSIIQLVTFRPAPAFILYMSLRHRSSTLYKSSSSMDIRNEDLQQYFNMICKKTTHVIYSTSSNVDSLAFWLTVSSELLFIIRSDIHLNLVISQLSDNLFNLVEKCFSLLNDACHIQLSHTMYSFLNETIDDMEATNDTISVFESIISQLHRNNTNPDLQIQIFSQLFHYVNMYIFNWIVGTEEGSRYLTRSWAIHLKERLSNINKWAESHGLELAFECHMDRIQQAVNLLITPKTIDQVAVLGATCYKLNSRQIEYLLRNYISEPSELPVTENIINDCIKLSQCQADESTKEEGLTVELLEERRLNVPFIFPQEGYIVEIQKGIPPCLMELIDYLERQNVCRFIPLASSNGSWNVHMKRSTLDFDTYSQASTEFVSSTHRVNMSSNQVFCSYNDLKLEIVSISFTKINNGIGLSIVAAQSTGNKNMGIYVKQVFEGGAAYRDGRIEPGDQLLSLNGHSLIGITQETAADIMIKCSSQLHFEVAKHAAFHNGLASWFFKERNHHSASFKKNTPRRQSSIRNNSYKYRTNRPLVIQPQRKSNTSNLSNGHQINNCSYDSINKISSQSIKSLSDISIESGSQYSVLSSLLKNSVPVANVEANNLILNKDYLSKDEKMLLEELHEEVNDEKSKIKDDAIINDDSSKVNEIIQQTDDISIALQTDLNNTSILDSNQHNISSQSISSGIPLKLEEKQPNENSLTDSFNYSHNDLENEIDTFVEDIDKLNVSIEDNKCKNSSLSIQEVEQLSSEKENRKHLKVDDVENNLDILRLMEQEGNDIDEPRVQIIGINETYNDPRTRRLSEIHSRLSKTNIDGSNLDFKDKMKMFDNSLKEGTT
uniref:Afadin (inferred by orthology to a human protein) n=1 Tax=Strongyloides venezuelensis TaxID=75913 RepID=A0A0K0FP93_STRVS